MEAGLTFESTIRPTVINATPLHKTVEGLKLVNNEGSGKYVSKSAITGNFMVLPEGFLPSIMDAEDDPDTGKRSVVLGAEEDIAAKVSSPSPIYTMPVGISYPDGSAVASLVFRNAIVEYRSNIGVISSKPSKIPGKQTSYGGSYFFVGLPLTRIVWMRDFIEGAHELPMSCHENHWGKEHNGYLWVNVNVSNTKPIAKLVHSDGTKDDITLSSFLKMAGKNLIGSVCLTATLKRVEDSGVLKRAFNFGIKFMQVTRTTLICSPGLANTVEFVEDVNDKLSSELSQLISKEKGKNAKSVAGSKSSMKFKSSEFCDVRAFSSTPIVSASSFAAESPIHISTSKRPCAIQAVGNRAMGPLEKVLRVQRKASKMEELAIPLQPATTVTVSTPGCVRM
ncbi:hypothetical protein BC830DRAFT_1174818 [Chytriomyces sp. MP71]|nr:hypothetical protein BC830DRAFT_1174818 [Chytriomyces sp. MP71]